MDRMKSRRFESATKSLLPGQPWHERAPRLAYIETARMRIATQVLELETIDISAGGVKLNLGSLDADARASLFTPGEVLLISVVGMPRPRLGQVRWYNDHSLGLCFDQALLPQELEALHARFG